MTFPFRPLACSACDAIRAGVKATLLRHGCTPAEVERVTVEPGVRGIHPAAASVRIGSRQLLRLADLTEFDAFFTDPIAGAFLARAVSRACEQS